MTALDDLITKANNVLAALEGLIQGDAAETIIPDEGVSYVLPAPMYDEATDTWTLSQDTADTDGLYKGLYSLASGTGCAEVELVSVTGHTNPTDSSAPARYKACGTTTFTDLTTVNALDGQQLIALEVRSQTPFSMDIRLTNMNAWCYTDDLTQSDGGWAAMAQTGSGTLQGVWTSGIGWEDVHSIDQYSTHHRNISIQKTFASAEITEVVVEYDYQQGAYVNDIGALYFAISQSIDLTTNYSQLSDGSGLTATLTKTETGSRIMVRIDSGYTASGGGDPGGSVTIKRITVRGTGSNPFGTDNCT